MKLAKNRDVNGELLTVEQACRTTNLGNTAVRKLASEAGAVLKIGNSYRIRKERLLNYIYQNFKVEE